MTNQTPPSISQNDTPSQGKSEGHRPQRPKYAGPGWRFSIWYMLVTVMLLWLWQDYAHLIAVETIPYSEFKAMVADGRVIECEVRESEIVGLARPAEENSSTEAETAAATGTTDGTAAQPAEVTSGEPAGGATGNAAGSTEKTVAQSESSEPDAGNARETPAETSGTSKNADGGKNILFRTVRVEDPELVEELQASGVKFTGVRPSLMTYFLTAWMLPLGLMFLLWFALAKRMSGAGGAIMNIGKHRAKLIGEKQTGVTFEDVAGCDEAKAELEEVVDFLSNPKRYQSLGARIPKGVLLVGPPGTGKTLLAKAVAGEASVPFFSMSGSDFVEMFVGVGAARVRDLFEQAKKNAPCIVFIDELDAIGRERGVQVGVGHDEREQTLNQLLVEMDGFAANTGVILLAASNRPEVLDKALLRPGRFDRQVVVDAPDLEGREAILRVHARGKKLADDVSLRKIAQATPGFSGADLANALNEAALLAARQGAPLITQRILEDAVEKVVAGPERKSRRLNEEEKRRVAYHESGHALVAAFSEHADPVHKISIIPRGKAALGYTMQLPDDQQFLSTRSELFDRLKGLLGGRAAEEVVFGEVSTGAENDLERATAIARQMVCMFGMGESVGLMHCLRRQAQFLPTEGSVRQDCSESTAAQVDAEVKRILADAWDQAVSLLKEHRDKLETVTAELLKRETLDGREFYRLIGREEAGTPVAQAEEPEPAAVG